jgi:hypothetical protein
VIEFLFVFKPFFVLIAFHPFFVIVCNHLHFEVLGNFVIFGRTISCLFFSLPSNILLKIANA